MSNTRKQTLETCIHNLEVFYRTIPILYPRLGLDIPPKSYTEEEAEAASCQESILVVFNELSSLLLTTIRKEVTNG